MVEVNVAEHPLLDVAFVEAKFPKTLGESPSSPELLQGLSVEYESPIIRDDETKKCVRAMLRAGGYKPSGRGKPASEYLVKAVSEGKLGTINQAVDICNIVSLHSGLPISVVDLDLAKEPLSISIADEGVEYVFNQSGQTIALKGLLCLFDQAGPCANGVKDSQRTKTNPGTTRVLYVIWGTRELGEQTRKATAWCKSLLALVGAQSDSGA